MSTPRAAAATTARGGTFARMKDYYEELWERLPEDLAPPDFELRRRFALANVARGERVLDLGCGAGDFTADARARRRAGRSAPTSPQAALDRARAPAPGARVPARRRIDGPLPFEDGAFDAVWASEVIEHVADTARWLSEVRRVLAPRRTAAADDADPRAAARCCAGGIERFSEPLGDHLHLYTRALAARAAGRVRVRPRSRSGRSAGPPLVRRLAAGPRGALTDAGPDRRHLRAAGAPLGNRRVPRPPGRGAARAPGQSSWTPVADARRAPPGGGGLGSVAQPAGGPAVDASSSCRGGPARPAPT